MKRFTPFEDQFIRDTYLFFTLNELSRLLGRAIGSIHGRINTLGLIIPDEIKKERHAKGIMAGLQGGVRFRFPKGHVPANKGKKMSSEAKRKIQHTFFTKGHKPKNTLYDNAITIRKDTRGIPQKHIRLSDGVWEYLSRHTYRRHHGSITPGMVVAFRDQNTMNCEVDNLYLLSRKDNMLRNSIARYPDDLKSVMFTISKLTKQIKRYAEK